MTIPANPQADMSPPTPPEALAAPWITSAGDGDDALALSLADLIERLGEGVERFDEAFARRIGATLHARAAHITLPAVERFGLVDVVATLYMDRKMRLVVTGHHDETLAEVTLRWEDRDFDSVGVRISRSPNEAAYTFATLDFSVRGREATLLEAAADWPVGTLVTLRCLSSIGDELHYRCLLDGVERALPVGALALTPAD